MAPTSSLARCGQPLTKAFPVVGSGSRMPTELAARAMATPGRGAATPDLVSGVDPVVLASSTPAAAGVPAAAKVVQLHLATASAVASASVLTSTTLGSGGCTSSPAPKSPPSVRPEVAAGVMIGTGSEASRQKPGPSCLDEPSVGGAIAVFTLDDLADSVLEAGVSADGNLGGGLGCVQVPAQSSTGSPTDVVVRRSKGNAATTDVDSIKKASKAVAIRNLDNPGDIRGTHWSRCWSLLQKEEERLLMKVSCRLFETVVLEIFANNDRGFSNRITF